MELLRNGIFDLPAPAWRFCGSNGPCKLPKNLGRAVGKSKTVASNVSLFFRGNLRNRRATNHCDRTSPRLFVISRPFLVFLGVRLANSFRCRYCQLIEHSQDGMSSQCLRLREHGTLPRDDTPHALPISPSPICPPSLWNLLRRFLKARSLKLTRFPPCSRLPALPLPSTPLAPPRVPPSAGRRRPLPRVVRARRSAVAPRPTRRRRSPMRGPAALAPRAPAAAAARC